MEQQKTFNFNLPSPYQTEMAELARRQRMAETLQQQSAEPVQKFGYGGIEVPVSPLTGLAKALNSFTAKQIEKDVLQEQKALNEKYRADQMGDVNRLVSMLEKRNATPEIDTGGEYYSPAVQSKAANAIDPSQIGQLRTPEMQNFALQYVPQLAPKAPIKGSAGDVFFNPATGAELFRVAEKPDFGQPIREQLPDGTIVTVVYDKKGNRKVVDTGGAKPAVSADTEARLKQEREISDRAFNQLSENQKRQLQNEAARIGISAEQLYYDTGVRLGRMPEAQPVTPPPAAPVAAPTVRPAAAPVAAPATGLPTPARAPALVQPPAAAAPTQMPTPASMAGMTPKMQQEILKDRFAAQYKREGAMTGLNAAINEAEDILTGKRGSLPTASGLGAGVDLLGSAFGVSTAGAQQADKLRVLAANLTAKMPRMEGPQSDADVRLYKESAGDVGNDRLPIERRLEALRTVRQLYGKYDSEGNLRAQPSTGSATGGAWRVIR